MKYIDQPGLLEQLLDERRIRQRFSTQGLDFQLVQFEKGELLTAPHKPMDALLFLARGRVSIYGLREDGSSFSVFLAGQDVLLGDMEFIRRETLPFFTEALDRVLCVALPVERYRPLLEADARFLRALLRTVSDKFMMFTLLENPAQPLEEKLLALLRTIQPDHILHGINTGTLQLHCSRAQLQRVVRKLCQEGVLRKLGKGEYQLRQDR
ncbi:cyclic nucleotide-binding domain-containing protein [Acutalibacter caecimuris]|uniref:cyclic nucleotide-binding domain-containing protein n=1 Tax=Acutalibacter caecimuris TaxID=3093657 RepID=UPI002AC8A0D0|nr:cyclic nucleotide-binding domain-containing protein [Acutalibacter sp. M00118]